MYPLLVIRAHKIITAVWDQSHILSINDELSEDLVHEKLTDVFTDQLHFYISDIIYI